MHSASYHLEHATIRDTQRSPIHAVRIIDALLTPLELDELAEQLRRKLSARGEPLANIVIIQGYNKETLQLHGDSYSVSRVRTAMFNAQMSWAALNLG